LKRKKIKVAKWGNQKKFLREIHRKNPRGPLFFSINLRLVYASGFRMRLPHCVLIFKIKYLGFAQPR